MNDSQQKAWDRCAPQWLVEVPPHETSTSIAPDAAPLDIAGLFGREAPLVVEIGSGTGDSPVAVAQQHPDVNVLAFEVFRPAVASTMIKINQAGLANVRLAMVDGAQALSLLLSPDSISSLRIFFPDPWHKSRHHKRRLISTTFADVVASRLRPDGQLLLATDWEEYALHMRDVLDHHPRFNNQGDADGWAPRAERPLTKYEARGIAQGRRIYDLHYGLATA